jgi:hypothetical protein
VQTRNDHKGTNRRSLFSSEQERIETINQLGYGRAGTF